MIAVNRNRIERMRGYQHQQGIVLIVGLVMLIALTLIGVTAMKSTTMDERIAANTQFKAIAFQTAESVLSDVANWDGADACYLAGGACVDTDAVFLDGTVGPVKNYATGMGNVSGRGEMTYLGEMPIAGISIGGPVLTPVVRIRGCASDAANICSSADAKLGNSNAKASHNMGVALVGIKP